MRYPPIYHIRCAICHASSLAVPRGLEQQQASRPRQWGTAPGMRLVFAGVPTDHATRLSVSRTGLHLRAPAGIIEGTARRGLIEISTAINGNHDA